MDTPLRLPIDQMRALGYRVVDDIVNHVTTLRGRRVGRPPDRTELERLLDTGPPAGPADPMAVIDQVVRDVLASIVHTDHPRFMAYIPGPSTYVGALADFIASGFNVFAGQWLVGAGPAVIERVTVDWLRQLCGLPETAGGLFVSGGTMANLVAIHAARVSIAWGRTPVGLIYLTSQTHRSIRKGLRFLGFDESYTRTVAVDEHQRMALADLREQVVDDRRRGHHPFCVVATAGTTSTGAVDPLDELGRFCAENRLWFHVDGAYGAAAVLSERAAPLLTGLGRADSVALDPHKWWFQPYEAGCVLVKDAATLLDAFGMDAEYLRETRLGSGPLNFYDLGPQLTRGFRALKVWMSIKTFGLDAFRRAVDHGIALAEHAERLLTESRVWEVVTPAQLAILTFRPRIAGVKPSEIDTLTRRVASRTLHDGFALVTTTELAGRPVLRLCVTHPETTPDDVANTIEVLARLAEQEHRHAPCVEGAHG